jgi:tripartite-type tricarboxylate transporter receptor subunit TctC
VLPPSSPPEAIAALRTAIEAVNADKDYADEAIKTLGYAPSWVAGADTNNQVRHALSVSPEIRTFIADYVKSGRK